MAESTLLFLELLATFGCLMIAAALGRGSAWSTLEAKLGRLAARTRVAILVVAFTPALVRLALLPALPIPAPVDLEEFAHFLQADTYASGRLTNPPHPMAEHLETFQELMRPTYCSFRPPGHAFFMAIGQVLFGHPWAGIVLSVCAFGASLCWMLQGWTSPGWALFGSLMFSCWYGIFGYWMNSYWGGAPAAIGGCLVLGALPRIQASQKIADALWFSVGAALMMLTRAYEGMFVLGPATAAIMIWLRHGDKALVKRKLLRVVLPLSAALLLFIVWNFYYNWRTVGNPFITPYQVGRGMYNMAAPFIFEKPNLNLRYRYQEMRAFFQGWELTTYYLARDPVRYWFAALGKVWQFWRLCIRPELTLPLLLIPMVVRFRKLRLPVSILAVAIAGLSVETWSPPYYYAPITGALVILMIAALRYAASLRSKGRRIGPVLVRGISLACTVTLLACVAIILTHTVVRGEFAYHWIAPDGRMDMRRQTERELESIPGRHLVIVHYRADHDPHLEWVWNRADIDNSRVVWARTMNGPKDQELIQYFHDRKVWILEPDDPPFRLAPVRTGDARLETRAELATKP